MITVKSSNMKQFKDEDISVKHTSKALQELMTVDFLINLFEPDHCPKHNKNQLREKKVS